MAASNQYRKNSDDTCNIENATNPSRATHMAYDTTKDAELTDREYP